MSVPAPPAPAAAPWRSSSSITVLDLPALYTRPDGGDLLDVLRRLELKPFDFAEPEAAAAAAADDDGDTSGRLNVHGNLPTWLTGVIKNRLIWLGEDEREQIWELASKRLAERAGQMGQTSSYRTFRIPRPRAGKDEGSVEITLFEPAVVGDNLGTKTWGSSYLMAFHLSEQLAAHITGLRSRFGHADPAGNVPSGDTRVLELGAGTGLVGLAARSLFHADVTVTDLAGPVLENLQKNVDCNKMQSKSDPPTGTIRVHALDWNETPAPHAVPDEQRYAVILAADPVYDLEHPAILARTVDAYLSRAADARFVIELPKRDGFQDLRAALYKELDDRDFVAAARGCIWDVMSGERTGLRSGESTNGLSSDATMHEWEG